MSETGFGFSGSMGRSGAMVGSDEGSSIFALAYPLMRIDEPVVVFLESSAEFKFSFCRDDSASARFLPSD
jgi:hypothetical protein